MPERERYGWWERRHRTAPPWITRIDRATPQVRAFCIGLAVMIFAIDWSGWLAAPPTVAQWLRLVAVILLALSIADVVLAQRYPRPVDTVRVAFPIEVGGTRIGVITTPEGAAGREAAHRFAGQRAHSDVPLPSPIPRRHLDVDEPTREILPVSPGPRHAAPVDPDGDAR